jgi:hypothetical protein
MKKLLSTLVIVGILSVSISSLASNSCKSCMSGHADPSTSCHTEVSSTEKMDCHNQADSDSCDMNDSGPMDCQICSHSSVPTAKIEAVTTVTMEKQLLGHPIAQQSHFSNQIPPPTFVIIQTTSPPPILANYLTFLEPIRLLI